MSVASRHGSHLRDTGLDPVHLFFDEVDQNLDAHNAEAIAAMCQSRSRSAQFIMVTLRKVSLQFAEHHIGVTHAGDGVSRIIQEFDRDVALELERGTGGTECQGAH